MIVCKGTEAEPHEQIAFSNNSAGRCPLCWMTARMRRLSEVFAKIKEVTKELNR